MFKKKGVIGFVGGIASIILWIVFNFFNPYASEINEDVIIRTFILLALPAVVAILSYLQSK